MNSVCEFDLAVKVAFQVIRDILRKSIVSGCEDSSVLDQNRTDFRTRIFRPGCYFEGDSKESIVPLIGLLLIEELFQNRCRLLQCNLLHPPRSGQ